MATVKEFVLQPITTTDALARLCARLDGEPFVTIDTEFMRERTYWAQLCLIQVASPGEEAAIDALADDLDLAPFFDFLNRREPLKVFHAARQDLEIFYKLSGDLPRPVFDTQVAAMVCGFGESVSYQALAQHFTKAKLDKSARFTDWARRPLSERQLRYALSDVTHLRDVYRGLTAQLTEQGRQDWIAEEMALITDPATYDTDPEQAWRRLRHRSRDAKFLGRLKAVAAWREREAQARDLPRNRIVRDETVLEIAAHPPAGPEELAHVRGVSEKFAHGPMGKTLFAALDLAQPLNGAEMPARHDHRAAQHNAAALEMLKLLLRIKAKDAGVAAKLIATSDALERLAARPQADHPVLRGWRGEVFGRDALKLLTGDLSLGLDGGDIALVARERET